MKYIALFIVVALLGGVFIALPLVYEVPKEKQTLIYILQCFFFVMIFLSGLIAKDEVIDIFRNDKV